jgi:phosphate starvation-inducible PhoH-like protein
LIKELAINIEDIDQAANLFGNFDENIKLIEEGLDVKIVLRGGTIKITGEEKNVESANKLFNKLMGMIEKGDVITTQNVLYTMNMIEAGEEEKLKSLMSDTVCITARGKQIRCKTYGQMKYVEAMRKNQIVFGIGPAGTGKTYLAMAMAITAMKNKEVGRIILTRPAVEAGEKLGFLPGDLQEKVDPYLRPLNTTPEQMKMFLTRIGFGSKAVITGDVTQIDLPRGKKSGLKEVMEILKGIEGIEFVMLSEEDVIRHPLVAKIIKAYEIYEKNKEENKSEIPERGE